MAYCNEDCGLPNGGIKAVYYFTLPMFDSKDKSQLPYLKAILKTEEQKENYELCAEIRDKINHLENDDVYINLKGTIKLNGNT